MLKLLAESNDIALITYLSRCLSDDDIAELSGKKILRKGYFY
jgi:hypothetical protein